MLDTNCPWTVEEAIRIGRRLVRFDLRWLEEPVWPPEDYPGLARVRAALRIPLASGENEATVVGIRAIVDARSEEHTSELQSQSNLVCRLLLEKKKKKTRNNKKLN